MSKENINRSIKNIINNFKDDKNFQFIKSVLLIEEMHRDESRKIIIQKIEKELDTIVEKMAE